MEENEASRHPRYEQYESSLEALVAVPAQLQHDLDNAAAATQHAVDTVDVTYANETRKVAKIRRTVTTGYEGSVSKLREHHILLPQRVRPAAVGNGVGQDALDEVLRRHAATVAAIDVQLRQVDLGALRARADSAKRTDQGQQAATALARRQQIIAQRKREEQAKERAAVEAAAAVARRRRKAILLTCTAVGIIAIVSTVTIILIHTSH